MRKFRYDRRKGDFLAPRRARPIAIAVGLTTLLAVTACSTPQYPRKLLSEVRAENAQKLLSLKVPSVSSEAAALETGAGPVEIALLDPVRPSDRHSRQPDAEPMAEAPVAQFARSPSERPHAAESAHDTPVLSAPSREIAMLDQEASPAAEPSGTMQTPRPQQTAELSSAGPDPIDLFRNIDLYQSNDLFQNGQIGQIEPASEVRTEPPARPRSRPTEQATVTPPAPRFEAITAHSDLPILVAAAAPRRADQPQSDDAPDRLASAALTERTGDSESDDTAARHPEFAWSPREHPHAAETAHDNPVQSTPAFEVAMLDSEANPVAAPSETADIPQTAEMSSAGPGPSSLFQGRQITQRGTMPEVRAMTSARPRATPPEQAPVPAPDPLYGVITVRSDTSEVVASPVPGRARQPQSGDAPDTLASGRGSEQTDLSGSDNTAQDQELPVLAVAETRPVPPLPQPAPPLLAPQLASTAADLPKAIEPPPPLTGLRVEFGPGSSELRDAARGSLTELAQRLSQSANPHLRLSAFAVDGDLSAGQARRLSLSRLFTVRDFLIEQGLRGEQIDLLPMPGNKDDEQPDRVDLEIDRS